MIVKKYSLLYIAFGLTILLAVTNILAKTFYLYWTIWWFDNATHLLAGFAGGLIAIWFLYHSDLFYRRTPTTFEGILTSVISVLIFAVAWEVFEYVNDIAQAAEGYVLDTTNDLLFSTLGAIFAGLFGSQEKQST